MSDERMMDGPDDDLARALAAAHPRAGLPEFFVARTMARVRAAPRSDASAAARGALRRAWRADAAASAAASAVVVVGWVAGGGAWPGLAIRGAADATGATGPGAVGLLVWTSIALSMAATMALAGWSLGPAATRPR